MNILETIVLHKKKEIVAQKQSVPVSLLEQSTYFNQPTISLVAQLQQADSSGIIAEFKRKSPSKGWINQGADVCKVTEGYQKAGAAALSVLTDSDFFGGGEEDFKQARQNIAIPMLRKDFMIDEYQIIAAKAMGADVVLLIAACLVPEKLRQLAKFSKGLGLEVLLEVHNLEELEQSLCEEIDLVGVNNRNLKTFEVDIDTSRRLAEKIPNEFVKISESGLSQLSTLQELRTLGYQGFLMGENFMKTADPAFACQQFIAGNQG